MAGVDGAVDALHAVGIGDDGHLDLVGGGDLGEGFAGLHDVFPAGLRARAGGGAGGGAARGARGRTLDQAGDLLGNVVVDFLLVLRPGGVEGADLPQQVIDLGLHGLHLRGGGRGRLAGAVGGDLGMQAGRDRHWRHRGAHSAGGFLRADS